MARKFSKSSTSGGNLFDIREIKNSFNRPSYDKNGNSNNSITNLDNKRRISRRINNDNDNNFTFSQIYRLVVGVILIMILCLGFGNGTLEFMNEYKTTYVVGNYVNSDIKSFDDINGKTYKFNNNINFDYTNINYIRLVLDVNKIPDYDYKLFSLTNNDNFTIDYIINKDRFNYTTSAFIYFSELGSNYSGNFLIRYPYPNQFNLYSFITNKWVYDGDNQLPLSITFSDDFTNYIVPVDIGYQSNLFIEFLNYNTTTLLSSYSNDFYYYDWRIKLNQLSNFRPLFEAHDLLEQYEGGTYARDDYMQQLQEYYNLGYVTYIGHNVNIPRPNDILWVKTEDGKNSEFSKQIDDFILVIALWLNPLTPLRASACFDLVNNVVTPNSWYNEWIITEEGESVKSSFLDFANGVFGFLYSPINFSYNIYVFFDFVTRW